MSGIQVRNTYGKLQENTTNNDLRDKQFITGSNVGSKKIGLDARIHGFYLVGATARIAEAGSSDTIIQLTGHDIKVGDVIRLLTTVNGIEEREASVKRVIDANNVELSIIFSAEVAAGDTFDIMRSVTPRYTEDGASLTTVSPSPVSFNLDSVVTEVTEDTVVPANNAPLPVKITSTSGDINITAGDLNVQTSHAGVNYDSMRIGDGTNLMGVNATLEALTHDADNLTQNTEINAKLPATIGLKAMAASLAVVIASDQSAIDVNDIGGTITLPTGASTEAKQDDLIAALPATLGQKLRAASLATTMSTEDQAIMDGISGKLPATLGQKARALSLAATLSSEDIAVIQAMSDKLPAALGQLLRAGSLSVTMSTEDQALYPDSLGQKARAVSFATTMSTEDQAIWDDMSAKLPAALGQLAKAASMSVAIASDQDALPVAKMDVVDHILHDAGTTAINMAGYTQLIADIGATSGKKIQVFNGQGTPFYIAVGAAASEVDKLIVCPGGFPDGGIEVSLPANARISAKAIGANITAGTIILNIMG